MCRETYQQPFRRCCHRITSFHIVSQSDRSSTATCGDTFRIVRTPTTPRPGEMWDDDPPVRWCCSRNIRGEDIDSTKGCCGGGEDKKSGNSTNDGHGIELDSQLKWFLHCVHREHVNLCRSVTGAMAEQTTAIALPLLELGRGHGLFGAVDVLKFAVPPSFLHSSRIIHNNNDDAG